MLINAQNVLPHVNPFHICTQQKEGDKILSAKSQHIQELERKLQSMNEELKVERQKLLPVQEVGIT